MRRMLDPKEAGGGLPSTIEFDKDGNRTVSKDLGIDGKLKLNSLISASNPDGDITKELGGGGGGSAPHAYMIIISDFCWFLSFSTNDYGYEIGSKTDIPADFYTNDRYKDLLSNGYHPAGGYYNGDDADLIASYVIISTNYTLGGYRPTSKITANTRLNIKNRIVKIVQLS